MLPTRFVILALPRTGSTNLVLFLKSVSSVRCKNEILHDAEPGKPFDPAEKLFRRPDRLIGFKAMPWHIPQRAAAAWMSRWARRSRLHLILLSRRNVVEQAISLAYAQATSRFVPGRPARASTQAIPVPVSTVTEKLAEIARWHSHYESLCRDCAAASTLRLAYEDVIAESGKHAVLHALGLPPPPSLDNPLSRMGGEEVWRGSISNYEELACTFLK